MKGNWIIGVCGGPVAGKSTFVNYLKDILLDQYQIYVIRTGEIAKGLDKERHKSGEIGPEQDMRQEFVEEIKEAVGRGCSHVIMDGSPRVEGQISFLDGVARTLGFDGVIVCQMMEQGKNPKNDHLFVARDDYLMDAETHNKRKTWYKNRMIGIRKEFRLILPENVTHRIRYPNGATHVVTFHFPNEMIRERWFDDHYSTLTKEEEAKYA